MYTLDDIKTVDPEIAAAITAEFDRQNIKERQAQGIAAALKKGVKFGRPAIDVPEGFEDIVHNYRAGNYSMEDVLKKCNMSRSTYYRKVKELGI